MAATAAATAASAVATTAAEGGAAYLRRAHRAATVRLNPSYRSNTAVWTQSERGRNGISAAHHDALPVFGGATARKSTSPDSDSAVN